MAIDDEFTATVARVADEEAVLRVELDERTTRTFVVDAAAVPRSARREGTTVAVVVRQGDVAAVTDPRGAARHWRAATFDRFDVPDRSAEGDE